MFARRKRKQEEESLVPHGLVWQATEEAISEEKKFPAVAPAAKIAETAPVPNEPAAPSASTYPLKKPVASSPPLFWRSQRKPELIYPAKAEPAAAPVPGPEIEQIEHRDTRPSVGRIPSTRHRPALAPAREHFGRIVERISAERQMFARLSPGLKRQIKLFSGRCSVVLKLLRNELRDDYKVGVKGSARLLEVAAGASSNLTLHAKKQIGRIFSSSNLRASPPASLSEADLSRSRTARIPRLPKIRLRKIQIRLRGLPLRARIELARVRSEWKLERHAALSLRRLWISSLLVALSAMFVFALVLTARNYGTASLPSNRLRSNTQSTSNVLPVASEIPVKPPAIHADIPVKLEKRRASQPKHKPGRPPILAASQRRPKPRYDEEEDYVAQDTYVYYGNKRAGSR